MKQIIILLSLVFIYASSIGQTGMGGVRRGGTSKEWSDQFKEEVRSKFMLTQNQVNALAATQADYQYQLRAYKADTRMDKAERNKKLAQLEAERKRALGNVLTKHQITSLDSLMDGNRRQKVRFANTNL